MKPSDRHAFINQLLVYTLVMICFSGTVGLSTVWLRHQISIAANQTKQFDGKITEIERRLAEITARIASEQSIARLEHKNAAFHLGLVAARESQIVRVTESPEERLAARRNIEIFADEAVRVTPVQFRLAGGGP